MEELNINILEICKEKKKYETNIKLESYTKNRENMKEESD